MCIFCDIVDGKIPSYKIYEDDCVLAFLDISQVTKGHTLLISKEHFSNFLEVKEDVLTHMMIQAQRVAKHLQQSLHCEGFNILSNVNEVAGQSVFHVHIHIIPRYTKEDACHIEFKESEQQDLDNLQSQLHM